MTGREVDGLVEKASAQFSQRLWLQAVYGRREQREPFGGCDCALHSPLQCAEFFSLPPPSLLSPVDCSATTVAAESCHHVRSRIKDPPI